MRKPSPRSPLGWTSLGAAVLAAGLWFGCAEQPTSVTAPEAQAVPSGVEASGSIGQQIAASVQEAIRAQERHTPRLMRIPGVVGTGVGLDEDGEAVVRIFVAKAGIAGLPRALDGIPTAVEVTGLFFAEPRAPLTPPAVPADGAAVEIGVAAHSRATAPASAAVVNHSTTDRWDRPVPIGISTGHPDITAGTIGARVTNGLAVFALSNNHVYANQNEASIGDAVIQPGSADGGSSPADDIGNLHDFVAIDFNGGDNTLDAAIASTATSDLGTSTPTSLGGYGTPSSDIFGDADSDGTFDNKADLLDLSVKKFGRTTSLTNGTVDAINVTVDVCYAGFAIFCTKIAHFVDQISITPGDFSSGGDSGSLIVSSEGNHPVGLLFAGSSSRTLANRIDLALNAFGVTVDGSEPAPADPVTDVAVTSVSAPSSVVVGDVVSVDVTVDNVGNQDVGSFDVTLTESPDGEAIPSQNVSGLAAGASTTVTFSWDTGGNSETDHTLTASHTLSDDDGSNDSGSTTVTVGPAVTDVAVTEVSAPSSAVQGDVVDVDVTVQNVGNQDVGSFNVDLAESPDGEAFDAQNVSGLTAGASTTVTFSWDTGGNSTGDHTLTASHDLSDDDTSNDSNSTTVTVTEASENLHVGDLDDAGSVNNGPTWTAQVTVTVHDGSHNPVQGVAVSGDWSGGASGADTCDAVTDSQGQCTVTIGEILKRDGTATFTVSDLADTLDYDPTANHDPDGDSNGTSITVSK